MRAVAAARGVGRALARTGLEPGDDGVGGRDSQADWLTTDTLRGALRPIGIELIDHLVFVDGDMVSLKDSEHLKGLQYV